MINPNIFIEFRQKYTGPAMRKYGNMFRAFDCPGDATMNRVRITDIKLLAGSTAVHSDMITWHNDETLEVAALQLINTLFGVPQISVMLNKLKKDQLQMVKFYTSFWNNNKEVILQGKFIPTHPLANYPILSVQKDDNKIIAIYDDYVISVNQGFKNTSIVNGKLTESIILKTGCEMGNYNCSIFNCKGEGIAQFVLEIKKGIIELTVPASGLIKLTQND